MFYSQKHSYVVLQKHHHPNPPLLDQSIFGVVILFAGKGEEGILQFYPYFLFSRSEDIIAIPVM